MSFKLRRGIAKERVILKDRVFTDLRVYDASASISKQPMTNEEIERACKISEQSMKIYENAREALVAHIAWQGR
jgi:hypothetical protein